MQKIIRTSDQICVVDRLKFADTYFTRLRGLIGTKQFKFGEGLLFSKCNSAHMWMMSIPIDLVFLKLNAKHAGREWTVLSIHSSLKPWKLLPVSDFKADDMLELPAGMSESISLKSGEVLCIA
jgi:uncharacterized membrane protein (UPF0127 family)